MTIDKHSIDQMAGFMRALNASTDQPSSSTVRTTEAKIPDTPSATHEMKLILERFHAAAGNAAALVTEESKYDSELREALTMEQTAHGSRIGAWEIELRKEGRRRFYNIVGQGGVTIASDLLLYEAAHGLVRLLNGGGRLNSPDAINLLRLEQQYASALNDAVLYKHYLTKKPHDTRLKVFEARYSVAKHRAIAARDRLVEIANRY